jgi:hypothetical protein
MKGVNIMIFVAVIIFSIAGAGCTNETVSDDRSNDTGIAGAPPLHAITPNAEVSSTNIPASMIKGSQYTASITMKNTGQMVWNGTSFKLKAITSEPNDAGKFTSTELSLPSGKVVMPGETYKWTFTMTAPQTTGSYKFNYRMYKDNYGWFGATVNKTISVRSSSYI